MKLFSLMLTEEQIEKLKQIAKRKSISVAALLRLIIEEFLSTN